MRSTVTAAILTLAILALAAPASAGPFVLPPPGYAIGSFFMSVGADTMWFSPGRPFGTQNTPIEAAARWIPMTAPGQRTDGVMLGAKKPFRVKLFLKGGRDSGDVHLPVDSLDVRGTVGSYPVHYPCRATFPVALDSLRLTPGASDTVWGATLVRQ
jgi:hypothetical protein